MTLEAEVATILKADATLMAILTGGVYTDEEVDVEGIRRGEDFVTDAAFDADGFLLPCALVRQRGLVPVGDMVRSQKEGDEITATRQVIEIYYYQHRGHAMIDLAKERAYQLLEGRRLTGTFPLIWNYETAHIPDVGPIRNSTTLRQEWVANAVRRKNP